MGYKFYASVADFLSGYLFVVGGGIGFRFFWF